jgi:hypothetical protein
MRRSDYFAPLLSTLMIPVSLSCFAQIVDVTACRTIEDSLQRFACYEALESVQEEPQQRESVFGRLFDREPKTVQPDKQAGEQAGEQQSPPQAVAETTATGSQQLESFGRDPAPAAATARVIEGADGKSELVDTVASLKEIGPKVWLVTLTSGQRWRQMSGREYRLRVGDQVTIYPGGWGNSWRLSSNRAPGFIQVERVD